jgi:hypothetical protein
MYQTHESLALFADSAITARYLFVKRGSDAQHCALCAAITDEPVGVAEDDNVQTDLAGNATADLTVPVRVRLLGGNKGTLWALAGNAIANGDDIVVMATAKAGSLQTIGASNPAKTYWKVGTAVDTATGSGDGIEFQPCLPVEVSL